MTDELVELADRACADADWRRGHLAAFLAGCAALDPDGYPTGGERGGQGIADPTGHAAQARKPGREARRTHDYRDQEDRR